MFKNYLITLITLLNTSLFAQNTYLQKDLKSKELCTFCTQKIIIEQSVFTSTYFHVLPDAEPRVPGHLLVVPKRHIAKAQELQPCEWEELSQITKKIAQVFSKFLKTDDYIILEKNGKKAFQQIPHVHFHFFPVTSQTWQEIFDIVPKRLSKEELKSQTKLFRNYFYKIQFLENTIVI